MDIVAMLPWWAGVMLALVLYLLLHSVASQPVIVTAARPGQVGAMVTQALWNTLASVGQYILPLLCLAGAGVSAWRRKVRKDLVVDMAQSKATEVLDGMSWQEFEMLVGEGFRLQGYQVAETGGGGADGGVDLVLTKAGEKFFVQCKQWRAFKVGVAVVRELYGVMAARGATGGFVVTSGRFTNDATAFARGRNIELIDGPSLHRLVLRGTTASISALQTEKTFFATDTARGTPATLACPACGKTMVRRTAKRGVNAGSEFWGCTGYPACRGTRQIG